MLIFNTVIVTTVTSTISTDVNGIWGFSSPHRDRTNTDLSILCSGKDFYQLCCGQWEVEVRTRPRQVPTHVDIKYSDINLLKLNFKREADNGLSCIAM